MSTASAFRAIADPTRRQILDILRTDGPQRAGDLADKFPKISRPAVSKHVRILRQAMLVRQRYRGRERWYTLNAEPLGAVNGWLEGYESFWRGKLQSLKSLAEEEGKD